MIAPYHPADLDRLIAVLQRARIATHLGVTKDRVRVRPVPELPAVSVVIYVALGGGVTRSSSVDGLGKTLSTCARHEGALLGRALGVLVRTRSSRRP